jgi:hypothetical protein
MYQYDYSEYTKSQNLLDVEVANCRIVHKLLDRQLKEAFLYSKEEEPEKFILLVFLVSPFIYLLLSQKKGLLFGY